MRVNSFKIEVMYSLISKDIFNGTKTSLIIFKCQSHLPRSFTCWKLWFPNIVQLSVSPNWTNFIRHDGLFSSLSQSLLMTQSDQKYGYLKVGGGQMGGPGKTRMFLDYLSKGIFLGAFLKESSLFFLPSHGKKSSQKMLLTSKMLLLPRSSLNPW